MVCFEYPGNHALLSPTPCGNPHSLRYDCADAKLQDTRPLIRRRGGNCVTCRDAACGALAWCYVGRSLRSANRVAQPAQYKSRVSIVFPDSPSCSTSIRSYRSNTLPGNNLFVKTRKPPNATPKTTAMTIKTPVPTKIRYRTTPHGGSVAVWLGSFQVTCVS